MIRIWGRDYLHNTRRRAFVQRVTDLLGSVFVGARRSRRPRVIKNILVARTDRLGDVFTATSVIPHLRRAFPAANIDFLAGSWSADILRSNPDIDDVLEYDSPSHDTARKWPARYVHGVAAFFATVRRLRRARYDLMLDLRAYPKNSVPLLSLGGGSHLVGFSTGGWGFLLDRTVPYDDAAHESEHLAAALAEVGVEVDPESLRPRLSVSRASRKETSRILQGLGIGTASSFVLVYTGSDDPKKRWPAERWQALVDTVRERYREEVVVFDTACSLSGCAVLPPLLTLEQFAAVAERASLFIGLDSLPTHLAASSDVPTIVLWCGADDHRKWSPMGGAVSVVAKDLDCAPCTRQRGCRTMDCMDISPERCLTEVGRRFDQIRPAKIFSNGFALYKFR